MDRFSKNRIIALLVLVLLTVGIFSFRLWRLYLASDDASVKVESKDALTYSTTVQAARGNLLDRNGKILVRNRASYNIDIINFVFFSGKSPNLRLQELIALCDAGGEQVVDTLPISMQRPYQYTKDKATSAELSHFPPIWTTGAGMRKFPPRISSV